MYEFKGDALIEPHWNVNALEQMVDYIFKMGLNRTTLECKLK